ncbi:MAG: hypothetical protein NVSMB2_06470 [Chloroflexota bacterium]
MVTLRPSASLDVADALIAAAGGTIQERLKPLPIYRVNVAASRVHDALRALNARDDLVKAADVEGEQVAQVIPNDPLYKVYQWNLRRIGMEQAWDLRPTAEDVIVAVLGTSVDLHHSDLRPNLML